MIIWTAKEGYIYESESNGKRYALLEMKCYRGKATSDIIAIWDEENDCFVNHVYGATYLDGEIDELDKNIRILVDEYEAKAEARVHTGAEVHYKTTKAGVKAWCSDVVDDILDREVCCPYIISHGNRYVQLPDLAEIHEMLENFLTEAEEVVNEC